MTAQAPEASPEQLAFRQSLLDAGVIKATSEPGLYHRSGVFERVVRGIESLAQSGNPGGYEDPLYFPPIMPRPDFVKTDYLKSFPNLVGSLDVFVGGDREHARLLELEAEGADWTQALTASEFTLCSAACHSLYSSLTGTLPGDGRRFEVQGFCFRHEPSFEATRLQSFRMHEFVYVGTPEGALAHREEWIDRALELLASVGLPVEKVVANDPFFGRAGRILANNQRETELKFEIVCPIASAESPTAISSGNYHMDHFGVPFEIKTSDGEIAHSACFGFGLERIALALFKTHGLDPAVWPASAREKLQL